MTRWFLAGVLLLVAGSVAGTVGWLKSSDLLYIGGCVSAAFGLWNLLRVLHATESYAGSDGGECGGVTYRARDGVALAGTTLGVGGTKKGDGCIELDHVTVSVGCPDEDAALLSSRPLLVYIAGPYTGPSIAEIDRNVAEAQAAGIAVMQRGHHVVCPHTMTHHWDVGTGLGYEVFIGSTLALLERCDAVLMVGNWMDSAGARGELARARELGLPVWYALDEVPNNRA